MKVLCSLPPVKAAVKGLKAEKRLKMELQQHHWFC
jgi:hypothetical protein